MGLSSSDINATYQKIVIDVLIGGTRAANVWGVDVSMGISQINAQATVHFTSRPSGAEEKKPIEIWAGYNGKTDIIFKGELSGLSWEYFPGVVSPEARDKLARLRLEWGGDDREYSSEDSDAIIRNTLEAMGIASGDAHIEGSGWTQGTVLPIVLAAGRAFWPYVEETDKLEGYRTFTDRAGVIRRYRVSGSTGVGQAWTYTAGTNIIRCTRKRTIEGIVNKCIVTGITYEGLTIGGPGVAEAQADNPFVPDPPRYITERIQSNLVEDDDTALDIAERRVADQNRRPETFEVEVIGNPLLQPLSVIKLQHGEVEAGSANLVIDRVQHTIRTNSFRTTFTTLGGNVVATPTNLPPVATFDCKLFQEAEDTGSGIESRVVGIADGGASSDPDGDAAALTFAWSLSVDAGTVSPSSGSEPVIRFVIAGAATSVTVELTVTDEGGATATLSRAFPLSASALTVEDLTLARGTAILASNTGQLTWNSYTLPGGAESHCLAPFAPAWGQVWGADDGHAYATIDFLQTDAVDLGAPHGAVEVSAVWVHELDTTRAWLGFADGKVYQGVLVPATPSATWTLRGTIPESPVREIRESIGALGSLRATAGQGYYASEDGGASWTLLHTFDTAWRMAAGFDLNLASGLNDAAPLFEEGGSTPTVPGGVEHIRGLTFGWRTQALYATDDTAALYATDDTFAALTAHADSLPAIGNHMIRSGNEDGVVYIAVGDGSDSAGGAVKWLPDGAAPWYIHQSGNDQVYMVGYGAAHKPTAAVDFVFVPQQESGALDAWWRYQDGVWSSGPLPQSGWGWVSIKIDPRNQDRWLLLGFPSSVNVLSGGRTIAAADMDTVLYLSEDAGLTWTAIDLPMPLRTSDNVASTAADFEFNSIGWQSDRSRYYLLGNEASGANQRACWWYGTTASDAVGWKDPISTRLRYSEAGLSGSYLAYNTEGAKKLHYLTAGLLLGTTAFPAAGDSTVPAGPIDSRPGVFGEAYICTPNTGLAVIPALAAADGVAYGSDYSSTWSGGALLSGNYTWIGAGQDYLFVGSQVMGRAGIIQAAYTTPHYAILYDDGPIDAGTVAFAMNTVKHLRVGRTRRQVCIAYGERAASPHDRVFAGWDGSVWSEIPLPDTFRELVGKYDVPYDVIEQPEIPI